MAAISIFSKSKPMARPPVSIDDIVGAAFGRVLDITTRTLKASFRVPRPKMIWFPEIKSIGFVVHGSSRPRWSQANPSASHMAYIRDRLATRPAERSFKKFMGRSPQDRAYSIEFPADSRRAWYSVGPLATIDYSSDKNSEKAEYTHDFGAGVRLYVLANRKTRSPSFWLIRGGRLKANERGLIH